MVPMSTDTNPDPTPSAWDDVRRLADEVRLKLHLAGMEAKDRWGKLEPQILELEQKVKTGVKDGSGKAADVVGEQVEAVAAGLRQFADELRQALGSKK